VLAHADEVIITAMNDSTFAGLGIGIVHQDQVIYAKGFGLAHMQQELPVTLETVFRIASISKTITAIGLMQLWEQEKFQLDAPVNEYLKAYQLNHPNPQAPPITFRHLLTHTSGLGTMRRLTDMVRPGFGLAVKPEMPIPPLSEYYVEGLKTELYPGRKWAYSNHGFATVGQLVEDISGEPFDEYMLRHVFEPLGAGTVFSSVSDMVKYLTALLNGGANEYGAVLKPETLRMMMQPQYQIDERLSAAMGLAFWLDNFDGHRIAWHSGDWLGFMSAMYVAPDDDLGIVVFTNTNTMNIAHRPDSIAREMLRRLVGIPDPASLLPRPDILETPKLWPELSGSYAPEKGFTTNLNLWMAFGGEVEVFVKNNRLAMRGLTGFFRKAIPLYRVDNSDPLVFQGLYDEQVIPIVFQRNAAGWIDRLCLGFLGLYTLQKRPGMQSLRRRLSMFAALGGLASLVAAAAGWRKLKGR
jgi:CubicO group peptidase (beta-lactamase class C family)